MTYTDYLNQALLLAVKANSHAIAHSLQLLSKAELICVISFLSQIVN